MFNKFMHFLKSNDNELILIAGIVSSLFVLKTVTIFGEISLWLSLVIIVISALYYSLTFYGSSQHFTKFACFLGTIVMIILYFALSYIGLGLVGPLSAEKITPSLAEAIYFSVVTWTTLGYGDFRPTEAARNWVMVEALIGYLFMALLVAKVLFLAQLKSTSK